MKNNLPLLQGIISLLAVLCLVSGWLNLFSPETEQIVTKQLFYILIGISFYLQVPTIANPKFKIPMLIAASLCVLGAFFVENTIFQAMKTVGLLGGVIISFSNRRQG